jgi:predicted ABC-type exoprotein transport system permease subunit
LGYFGDSIFNSFGDIAACLAGFFVASRITARAAVLLFILIELLCLLIIHDNLTLNVIMLTWPIDVIREWQVRG